jgi:hypothetical protein
MFQIKAVEKTKTMFSDFSANRAVYEIISKNMMEPEREQTTGACAWHIG